jgi:starch phosphorylase
MVALTSNVSPVTALAGHRPHATCGCTSRIGILPITLDKLPSQGPAAPGGPGYSHHALGSLSVKAIRRLTVRPALPEALSPLHPLMLNLRWSWHRETQELFADIDPERWQRAADPAELLAGVTPERLGLLADDAVFVDRLHRAVADLEGYLTRPGWYERFASAAGTHAPPRCVAYFSPEFGITAALPQYSGGLGILAGDHLKACSDLGVPLIGVGLLYRHGYFAQSLSADGWQAEHYPAEDPNGLPLTLLHDPAGAPARVAVGLADGASVTARVWVAQVGRVPLLLLDSYVADNDPALREVTDRLYGGGSEHRLRQELLLGVGGVRAVRAFCQIMDYPEPEVFHTNEGHAGFLGLERIREYLREGLSYEASLEMCRAGTVFTTHTPVPAGIDRFDRDLVARQFAGEPAEPGLPPERILALGAETFPGGDPGVFNMAVMGMRLAQRVNGVSRLHGRVSRAMFAGLWPGFDTEEVPIGSITNGVHAPTWVAREIAGLAAPAAGDAEPGTPEGEAAEGGVAETARWERVASDLGRVWAVRGRLRQRLVEEARRRLRESWHQRGASDPELTWIDTALDENILTIGFARRVPSYKRLTMMLHDKARLRELLLDPRRPVQVVVAGKAHPADEGGKRLIREMVEFADDPEVRHRIVFLPDYDMALARILVQGCDVWLNNPLRPLEACGTSGMKSALNGGLNLSVLDGWWDEWYDGRNGWAIPSADRVADPRRRDEIEAAGLYDLLGRSVAPLFYERDADGLPRGWLEMVGRSLRDLGPRVQATRMVREYVTEMYRPAARSSRLLGARGYAGARELAEWKARVAKAWPGVRVELVEGADGELSPGTPLTVRASVALGDLSPQDVAVQVVYGRAGEADEIANPQVSELSPEPGTADSGAIRYSGVVQLGRPGPFGYTVRVLPSHPLLADPAETGLVSLPPPPAGMSDGDLR